VQTPDLNTFGGRLKYLRTTYSAHGGKPKSQLQLAEILKRLGVEKMSKSRVAQLEQLEAIEGNDQIRLSLLRAIAGY